jgi:hypothetical protein
VHRRPLPTRGSAIRPVLPGVGVRAEDPGGVGGGLRPAFHAQLGEQRRNLILHGLLGQVHALADLPVGQSLSDELQDAPFLGGELGQRVAAPAWSRIRRITRLAASGSSIDSPEAAADVHCDRDRKPGI